MNNMQKAFKRKAGLADGGRRPDPSMLGSGLAAGAGRALAGRGAQLAGQEAAALGAPVAAPMARPVTAGGLSGRRDGTMPPAQMLAAQRRGMADGGLFELEMGPPPSVDSGSGGSGVPAVEAPIPVDPRKVDVMGRPYNPNSPKYGYRGYDKTRVNMYEQQQADAFTASLAAKRAASGLPPLRNGMADGGSRGNADEIEEGNGGVVRGPGGPTDDEVGPVALSNKEYVLPADTVEAVGEENLDQLRDATHEFVNEENRPRGLADGGKYELVGPEDPGWFARQRSAARTERSAAAAVKAGTANADQQASYDRTLSALDSPEVMNPLSEVPGIGLASRGASAATAAAPGIISGLRAQAGKAVDYVATKVGAPALSKTGSALPGAASQGITNAQRVAATPAGYVTGGLSAPAAPMAKTLASGALPTAPRIGANVLGSQTADSVGESWFGDARAAQTPSAGPAAQTAAASSSVPAQDARVAQELGAMGVSAADQGSGRVTYAQAQGLSRGSPSASKNYRLGGGQYSEGNADIFAGSTRKDGTLNSFSGVGGNNRPNWEDRPENRQNHLDALARAEKDKASVTSLAVSHINEGTTDGLDRAYRLAAGNPEATAAVEAARQQYGLRKAAMGGNKEAGAILRQQDASGASRDVANITAGATERVGLAKARADMAKADRDQRNSDRSHNLAVRTANREDGKLLRDRQERALADAGIRRLDADGNVTPEYQQFATGVHEEFLKFAKPGQPIPTLDDMSEGDQQILIRAARDKKALEPGFWEKTYLKYFKQKPFVPTEGLSRGAPQAGTYDEGFVYDTVQDGNATPLAVPSGLSYEQQKRMRGGF